MAIMFLKREEIFSAKARSHDFLIFCVLPQSVGNDCPQAEPA